MYELIFGFIILGVLLYAIIQVRKEASRFEIQQASNEHIKQDRTEDD